MSYHPENAEPYLSVVVTTRNDDHGGDPLKRLQAFVNCFDEQCRRTGLAAEVIVVEWNPPQGRPHVGSLLRLPKLAACAYRFIDVPPELHDQLRYADVLPLFQMIAKNVGIRRARGRFVLATNIDIIFATELIAHLACRPLRPGYMYRVDRHDIQSDFPLDAPLEDQMAYCATHQLRVHTSRGSFPVSADGAVVSVSDDIVDGRVIRLGEGWHVREGGGAGPSYRWASGRASLIVDWALAPPGALVLDLELESNPYDPRSVVRLEAYDRDHTLLRADITGRTRLRIPLGPPRTGTGVIELLVAESTEESRGQLPVFERRDALHYRVHCVQLVPAFSDVSKYPADGWSNAYPNSGASITAVSDGVAATTDPQKSSYCLQYGPLQAPSSGILEFAICCTVHEGRVGVGVLSGSRAKWIQSSQIANRDGKSFRFYLSFDLPRGDAFWLMIYNDHPDGVGASRFTVHTLTGSAAPSDTLVDKAPSAQPRSLSGRIIRMYGRAVAWARTTFVKSSSRFRERLSIMLDRFAPVIAALMGERLRVRIVSSAPEYRMLQNAVRASDEQLHALAPLNDLAGVDRFLRECRPDNLHVNGCGDFQLMAREHWHALRAYPAFETFSMNIDGLFSYIADSAGIKEEVLQMPIYHLEHEVGSGWSPEGEALLRKRIAERGITWLDASTVYIWAAYMRWLGRPMIFNGPDWGFGDIVLRETADAPVTDTTLNYFDERN